MNDQQTMAFVKSILPMVEPQGQGDVLHHRSGVVGEKGYSDKFYQVQIAWIPEIQHWAGWCFYGKSGTKGNRRLLIVSSSLDAVIRLLNDKVHEKIEPHASRDKYSAPQLSSPCITSRQRDQLADLIA